MTVVFKQANKTFDAHQVLVAHPDLANAIVEQALAAQAGSYLDMIADTEKSEYITRASINERLRNVKDDTEDYLEDVMNQLRLAVMARFRKVQFGAAVMGIEYDLAGEVVDIKIDVSVS